MLTEQGLYSQALAVLEAQGAGAVPSADVDQEGLSARAVYESKVSEDFGARARDQAREGKARAALGAAREGMQLCPWSTTLHDLQAESEAKVAVLDHLEFTWGAWQPESGAQGSDQARALLAALTSVRADMADSPRLQELHGTAQAVLVSTWAEVLSGTQGVLPPEQQHELRKELSTLTSDGIEAATLADLVDRTGLLQSSPRAPGTTPAEAIRQARELAETLTEHTQSKSLLQPCFESLETSVLGWARRELPDLLDSERTSFEALLEAESLVGEREDSRTLREALAGGHLRRAEILGAGGVASLLGAAHLARAEQLGWSGSKDRLLAAQERIATSLRTTDWPEVMIGIDVGPEVEPWLQSIVTIFLRQEILARSKGWTSWRWVEPRIERPQVLITFTSSDFVGTRFSELREVQSRYFSHFQTVPNPLESALELAVDRARDAMNRAESNYESAVRSHNLYPTQYSLTAANIAYNTYARRVDDYNDAVSAYNVTPSTIEEEVYLPYTFREGTMYFGWKAEVTIEVNGRESRARADSLVSEHVRIGTRRTDRTPAHRVDNGLSFDMSTEASVAHLQAVVEDLCDQLSEQLMGFEYTNFASLTEEESAALSGMLHPWGPRVDGTNRVASAGWLRATLPELDLVPTIGAPAEVVLAPAREPPPVASTPRELADWYGPILCEVRTANRDQMLGHGSGVLVSGDGLVLTCEHVLRGPINTIRIHEGPWKGDYDVDVVFANQVRDVAVLRARGLQTTRWASVRLGFSSQRGEEIIAMGNPGLPAGGASYGAVTVGIVSSPRSDTNGGEFLVADITIAQGSSGGPLISIEDGAVVGIVQLVAQAGIPAASEGGVAASGFTCLAAPADRLGDWIGLRNQP